MVYYKNTTNEREVEGIANMIFSPCKISTQDIKENWEYVLHIHSDAIYILQSKLSSLGDEYELRYSYNPIEHIKSRIKTPLKIQQKLLRRGFEPTCENALRYITDIGGIRIVCSFIDDIYMLADNISLLENVNVIAKKDYIKSPKPNGYRSLHLLVQVPVMVLESEAKVVIEIQLRTVAMDFWASSEHRMFYKSDKSIPEYMLDELRTCARIAAALDEKMQSIRRIAGSMGLFDDSKI